MGVFGFGSADSDTSLDILHDIEQAYKLKSPITNLPIPNKHAALSTLQAGDPIFRGDGGEAHVAYHLISDGFTLHSSVLEAAIEWLRLECDALEFAGDAGGGWCNGGADRRIVVIKREVAALADALISSYAYRS